jgi:hypothetical protein
MSRAEMVTSEQQAVAAGRVRPCGKVCDDGCHGPVACVRGPARARPGRRHGADEAGRKRNLGSVVAHAGSGADGALMQWMCLPGDHDGLTGGERTAKRAAELAAAKEAATRAGRLDRPGHARVEAPRRRAPAVAGRATFVMWPTMT